MHYEFIAINEAQIPAMNVRSLQYALDTYVSEMNKVVSTWRAFSDTDLGFRPHAKSSSVQDVLKHQLLSERRFFGEFLGTPEPPPDQVLPSLIGIESCCHRVTELALARLPYLAGQDEQWWSTLVPFFDVRRERVWIFWRRILHTAHHRTQLSVYLRMLDKAVPATYGPTGDVTWKDADPTASVEAAGRR